eukprot:5194197-Prymnesium_polylepis.1
MRSFDGVCAALPVVTNVLCPAHTHRRLSYGLALSTFPCCLSRTLSDVADYTLVLLDDDLMGINACSTSTVQTKARQ